MGGRGQGGVAAGVSGRRTERSEMNRREIELKVDDFLPLPALEARLAPLAMPPPSPPLSILKSFCSSGSSEDSSSSWISAGSVSLFLSSHEPPACSLWGGGGESR